MAGVRGERWIAALGRRVECPNCGRTWARFAPGPGGVAGRRCWACDSLERHRALALALRDRPELLTDGMRVLHIAPEPAVSRLLPASADVVQGDLSPARGQVRVDVSAMPEHADASFDAIICVHVLEHVLDDRAALRELRRVLRPDGWAVIHVPVVRERTIEDPGESDPARRLERFGQEDHVRSYGPDFLDRLSEAGLRPETVCFDDPELVARYGLRAPVAVETVVFSRPSVA